MSWVKKKYVKDSAHDLNQRVQEKKMNANIPTTFRNLARNNKGSILRNYK